MSARNSFSLNRIKKDIEEISLSPIEGIGISSLEDSSMKYVVNICLLKGIYKGYCIQLFLTFPDNYPLSPPTILIYPGQLFSSKYHYHISDDISKDENGMNFKKINFNLLDKDFMSSWIPNYSLRTLLEKIQNFLSDPDFPEIESSGKGKKKSEKYLPDKKQIDLLMKQMKSYQRSFLFKGKNEKKVHTWEKPFPEMYFKEKVNKINNKIIDIKLNKEEKLIKDNLYCSLLRKNYIYDNKISLGFPFIGVIEKKEKEKIKIYPIPELLSDEAFKSIKIDEKQKLKFYYNINLNDKFKSESEFEYYNDWIPMYLDDAHYLKNKENILNILYKMKFGPKKKENNELSFNDIFEIFADVLNRIIIGIIVNEYPIIKSNFIKAYFHFFLLFRKFYEENEKDYIKYLNYKINKFINKNRYRDKKRVISELGNFFTLLFFSNIDLTKGKMKEYNIWELFCEEHLIRQMYWIFHNGHKILKILEKIDIKALEKEYPYIKEYENIKKEMNSNEDYKIKIKENQNSKFIEELKNNDIYKKVLDIICSDGAILAQGISDQKYIKNNISKKMRENFQNLFDECTSGTKSKLCHIFSDYSSLLDSLEIQDKYKKEQFKEQEDSYNEEIHNLKVNKLIYDENYKKLLEGFLEETFEYQRANKILLINYIIFKKNKNKELIKQVKKNYGVYLDIDNIMKEIKETFLKIKTYNQLYKYLESDFCIDENDVEIIRKVYEKAKEQKYVQANEEQSFSSHSSQSIFRLDFIGGRSNFRENQDNRVENNRNNYNNYYNNYGRGYNRGGGYNRGRGYRGRGYRGRGRGYNRGREYNRRY